MINCNRRFPGQYADAESGLSYNYFRHYDPAIGRYAQKDPIGQSADVHVYAYARKNPVPLTDFYGLGTLQIGLTVNVQIGPININGTYGVVVDTSGGVGTYSTVGAGGGIGADAFGGLNIAISNGDSLNDVAGPFINESSGVGAGIAGGVDAFAGLGSHGQAIAGGGVSIGIGAGAQTSVGASNTSVSTICP